MLTRVFHGLLRPIKITLIILAITSCSQPAEIVEKKRSLSRLNWLPGSWKSVSENTTTYENWTKINDSLFTGNSIAINGKDTVFAEKITLKENFGQLFYSALVSDQNDGKAVDFEFVECKNGEFIFENKGHDFPQRIIYKNPQVDFLCARIEGILDGKYVKEDVNFVRVK